MKHCEKYIELISAYVDGELSEAEVSELEAHLVSCEDCRRTLEFYRELSTLEQESMVEPPAGLHDSIMTAVKREKRRPFVRAIPALVGSLAACLVIAVGVGYFGGFGGANETAGMDVMMSARTMDTTVETEGAVPAEAGGLVLATTGAGASVGGEVAFDSAPNYNGAIADSEDSGETTAAYDPSATVESPYSDSSSAIESAKLGDSYDSDKSDYTAPAEPRATPAPQGDNSTSYGTAANDLPLEETTAEATTTDAPRMMSAAMPEIASAIVDGSIVIDADAVTDFSYDNRMYELSDDADANEMLKLLDHFASLELKPLGEVPNVDGLAFSGVTVWYGDTILVFVYYPDGYVVEGDNWYAFE